MGRTITLREAIDTIKREENGAKVPFSIDFVTLDSTRPNKPSKHVHLDSAEECGAAHNLVRHSQIGVRPLNGDHQYAVNIDLIMKVNGQHVA